MDKETFQELMLQTMEEKRHWAWPAFTSGLVKLEHLHHHFENEYEVYVRDFPVLIARAYVKCPIAVARQELIENIYEEETGGIAAGKPHPELFLEYPKNLGMDMSRYEDIQLGPKAAHYRDILDRSTLDANWQIGAAVTTIFIEGTPYERGELDEASERRPVPPLEEHPLVKHYGLPLDALALTKAHRSIEGEHRGSAWHIILNYTEAAGRESVLKWMKDALTAWKDYRDEVAALCRIGQSEDGSLIQI
jgi:hypothetical protein